LGIVIVIRNLANAKKVEEKKTLAVEMAKPSEAKE